MTHESHAPQHHTPAVSNYLLPCLPTSQMGADSSLEERHNREHTSSYPPYPFYPRYVDIRVFPLEFTTGQISSQVLVYRKINPTLCNTGCVLMVRYRYPNLSCVGIEKGSRQLEKDYSKVMNQSASIRVASIWWMIWDHEDTLAMAPMARTPAGTSFVVIIHKRRLSILKHDVILSYSSFALALAYGTGFM